MLDSVDTLEEGEGGQVDQEQKEKDKEQEVVRCMVKEQEVAKCRVKEKEIRLEKPVRKNLTWEEESRLVHEHDSPKYQDPLIELLGPPDQIHIPEREVLEREVI